MLSLFQSRKFDQLCQGNALWPTSWLRFCYFFVIFSVNWSPILSVVIVSGLRKLNQLCRGVALWPTSWDLDERKTHLLNSNSLMFVNQNWDKATFLKISKKWIATKRKIKLFSISFHEIVVGKMHRHCRRVCALFQAGRDNFFLLYLQNLLFAIVLACWALALI